MSTESTAHDTKNNANVSSSESNDSATANNETQPVKAERKRRSQEEIKRGHEKPCEDAICLLIQHDNSPKRAMLNKTHCAAVLTLGFGKHTSSTAGKQCDLQENVMKEVDS